MWLKGSLIETIWPSGTDLSFILGKTIILNISHFELEFLGIGYKHKC